MNNVVKTGTNKITTSSIRLRLDIGGSNIRIQDSLTNPSDGLDMDFKIDKHSDSKNNKCTITIWNMSPSTTQYINDTASIFEFYAADEQGNFKLAFKGVIDELSQSDDETAKESHNIARKNSKGKKGSSDIPTNIVLVDGKTETENTISTSFKGTVSSSTIINECITSLGVPKGYISTAVTHTDITNYVARGKTNSVLDDITKRINAKWYISNGLFNMVSYDEPEQTIGIVLNADNSQRPESFKTAKQQGRSIKTAFIPSIDVGSYVKFDFPTYSGIKQVSKFSSSGNNYGTKGETEIYVND